MNQDYEKRWREAMADYAPAASDADWNAMQQLLPPGGAPRRWWRPAAGGALLLLLALLLWQYLPRRENPAVGSFPLSIPYTKEGPTDAAPRIARFHLPDLTSSPLSEGSSEPTVGQEEIAAGKGAAIGPDRHRPTSVAPLPLEAVRPLSPAHLVNDSLLRRLYPLPVEKGSRSFYPTPLFDKH